MESRESDEEPSISKRPGNAQKSVISQDSPELKQSLEARWNCSCFGGPCFLQCLGGE